MEAVVVEAHLPDPGQVGSRHGAAEGVRLTEPRVVDQDQEHVGRAVGRLRARDDGPVGNRLIDRPADRAPEVPVRDRQHRAIGDELAHGLCEAALQRLHALFARLDDGLRERTRQRLLHRKPLLLVEHRDDAGGARGQVLADLVVHLGLHPLVDELADEPARRRPRRCRREQRRCRQAHEHTDGAAPFHTLAAAVVGRLGDGDRAVRGVCDQDRGVHRDLLPSDELREPVEVLRRFVDARVATDEHVGAQIERQPLDSRVQREAHLRLPARESAIDAWIQRSEVLDQPLAFERLLHDPAMVAVLVEVHQHHAALEERPDHVVPAFTVRECAVAVRQYLLDHVRSQR